MPSNQQDKIDLPLLQVRWVLGGLRPEDLPDYAALALEQGFDGTALRQLAGLVRPTLADLGTLPEKAFTEIGLPPIDTDEAVDLLIARGAPYVTPLIAMLVESFPAFSKRWRSHIASWGGEVAGSYVEMAEFVHFFVEDLYEAGEYDEVRRAFEKLEQLLSGADQEATDLIGFGFFETLQNFASWRPYGNQVFEQFLGSRSKQIWAEIQRIWAGKSSLMDVIRAERES